MRGIKYAGIVAIWVNMLWGIYTPERPQWLKDRLNSLPRLEHRHVSHIGNRSYFVETGNVRSWSRISENVTPGSPENMAREFLSRHAAEFGFPDGLHDIELKGWRETIIRTPHDGYRVEFIQKVNGIPVLNSDIGVIVSKNGLVVSAFSNYYPNIRLDSFTPQVSNNHALSSAINFLQAQGVKNEDVQLMILAYPRARLVYRVSFTSTSPSGHWEVLVDAITGEVLHAIDRRKYFDGSGYVFMPDPVTSAHTHYGQDGFIDNNDQNSAQLQAQLQTVVLRDLDSVLITAGEDTSYVYILSGPYVRIWDIESPTEPNYTSESGEFYFNRSQMGFEAVMSYYHIDNFARYVAEMGYTSPVVYVDPHINDTGAWCFADSINLGTGGVDAGEDAGILIHEYTHAIQDALMNGFDYSYDESGALSEGYADYFGGSYAYSLDSFNPDTIVKWGLHPYFNGRPLNSQKHYPEDFVNRGNPHENGEIWSACLWQLFNTLGRTKTDNIALWSLSYLWSYANFADAAKQILDADYYLYSGDDLSFIRSVFYNRGILHPPTIQVIFPTENVKFVSGSVEEIRWQIIDLDNLADHVRLYYRVNNGPWIVIGDVFLPSVSYSWLIPLSTGIAQVKVELMDRADNVLAYNVSEQFYIVSQPGLDVLYPEQGDTITGGEQIQIQWSYSDPNNVISYLDIFYTTDGTNWISIDHGVGNLGYYNWIVPMVYTNQARVLLKAYNIRDIEIKSDTSGNFVMLPPPQVELLWPNSHGIVVEEAGTYAIRYNGDAVTGIHEVKAWFSYDGGQTWPDTIGRSEYPYHPTHVENDTIDWPVTQHPTEHGRVKVVLYDAVNQTAVDISSYDITVRLARPGNVAASVSSNLESVTLTWTDRSNYEDGYIIQKRGAGGDWETIASLGPNTNSFTDEDVQPFSDYEYRIWAYNSTTASDTIILPIATDKIVADSALAPNSLKQMVFANNKLVWVYELNGGIYMKTSSDYGMTWSAPQLIGSGVDPSIDAYYSKIAAIWYDTTANVLKYIYGTPEQYSVYDLEGLNYDVYRTRASVALAGSKTHIARYLTTNHGGSTEVCLISFPSNSPQSFTRTVIYGNGSNRYHVLGPYINDQQVVTFVIDSIYGIDTSIALCCDTLYVYKGTSLLQRVSRKGKIVVSNPVYAPNFYDENLWAAAFNDTVVIYGYLWDAITMDLDNCSVPAGSDWLYMTLPTASSVTNAYLIFAERDGNLHLTEIKRGSKPLDTWHISSDSTLTVTDVVSARAATVVPTTDPTKIYLAVLNNRSQSDYDGIVSYKWFDVDFTGGSPYSNGERLNLRTGISLKSSVTSSDKLMLTLSLAESEIVSLRIYNINGRILKEIPGKHYTAGIHRLEIDLRSGDRNSALPSGIYFLKADIGNKSFVKKLVVIK